MAPALLLEPFWAAAAAVVVMAVVVATVVMDHPWPRWKREISAFVPLLAWLEKKLPLAKRLPPPLPTFVAIDPPRRIEQQKEQKQQE